MRLILWSLRNRSQKYESDKEAIQSTKTIKTKNLRVLIRTKELK